MHLQNVITRRLLFILECGYFAGILAKAAFGTHSYRRRKTDYDDKEQLPREPMDKNVK